MDSVIVDGALEVGALIADADLTKFFKFLSQNSLSTLSGKIYVIVFN